MTLKLQESEVQQFTPTQTGHTTKQHVPTVQVQYIVNTLMPACNHGAAEDFRLLLCESDLVGILEQLIKEGLVVVHKPLLRRKKSVQGAQGLLEVFLDFLVAALLTICKRNLQRGSGLALLNQWLSFANVQALGLVLMLLQERVQSS